MSKYEGFRWLVVSAIAVAAGVIAGAFLPAALAGGVGVAIGLAAGYALKRWDDAHFPDLVEVYERAKQ